MPKQGEPPVAFGVWLDVQLARKGWKPADLARATGIYPSTISKYRNGVQVPHAEQARLLADALGVPLETVLDAAGKGPGLRSASVAQQTAYALVARIPDDLLPLSLPWLEALADERRWSRYRTAILEAQRFADEDHGPADGPEPKPSPETEAHDVPVREPYPQKS